MKNILGTIKDFKIIPNNFKSAGEFELISNDENEFKIKLNLLDKTELEDYKAGGSVEIFGVNNVGLIYFETTILKKEDDILTLAMTSDYSVIQRREYSRVNLEQGRIVLKDMADNFIQTVEDISAGGVKLICNQPLSLDKAYEAEVILSNNMKIDCSIQPVRVVENGGKYIISCKFINLENVDRIVLVQYAFKIKMEEQNRAN